MPESLEFVLQKIRTDGPYDALMGFSQGAGMVTRVISQLLQDGHADLVGCVVLVGGMVPSRSEVFKAQCPLPVPSLHIIGEEDPFKSISLELITWYQQDGMKLCRHNEGHNIPSLRTELYPIIDLFIKQHINHNRSKI